MIGLLNCVSIERLSSGAFGTSTPQGGTAAKGVVTSSISPLIPDMLWCPGVGVGAGRVRIAAEQLQRPDQIYLLGNSSGDFTVAKEAPRSIKHFR